MIIFPLLSHTEERTPTKSNLGRGLSAKPLLSFGIAFQTS
jgi:hypothetical protein